jgi:hypothetical protein
MAGEQSDDAISQLPPYTAEHVFKSISVGDSVEVSTTGTAGDQEFTGAVTRKDNEDLLGDAEQIRIEIENRSEGWVLQAERDTPDEPYGFLYACGASPGQRVESVTPQFSEVESAEEARDLLSRVEPQTTMLECKVTGNGGLSGMVDTIRRFERRDEVQLRRAIGGAPDWGDEENLVPSLIGKPARVVEYEGIA